ncbi:uncharacterized protein LOC105701640 [Orussus abietinus]|uniref:uncharacterized protein LOC105701640 n=1 Tax=Orussus abietinus TaxID=222816 RepID=UPI000C715BD4|nr:uncharacterized protein LOC105701640 [Orussus abietinus]
MNKALYEMDYHRKRMNEYLCHGFMAEEIFKEVGSSRVKRGPDISSASLNDFLGENNVTVHDKLLSDEGSSKYKDWLHKSTTLDDIYRHYAPRKKTKKKGKLDRLDGTEIDEFDGEVTGFAMPAPLPSGKIGHHYESFDDPPISASSGHGYQSGGPYDPPHEYFPPAIHEEYYYSDHGNDRPSYHGKGKGGDLSIKDFFEIALTALAFLAFGLFVIQLLMNVTNAATMTAAAAIVQADIDGTRFKRHVSSPPLFYSGNEELNELSHRVLRSIEAAMVAEHDNGNCLRRILCEDNRHSREIGGGRKIWVPVWSLGMSWVSGRVTRKSKWSAILDSLKATILGIGNADCASLYPSCDLGRERMKRRRKRRK